MRSALLFVGTLAIIAAGLGIATVVTLYQPPQQSTLFVVELGISMLIVVLFVCQIPRIVWVRVTAGKPQPSDRAPAEIVASLFALPLATALTGMAIAVPPVLTDQLERWNPEWSRSWGWVTVEFALGGAVVACLVPFAALRAVIAEREGRRAALFEPSATDHQFDLTLAARWSDLRTVRRYWLPTTRSKALGDEQFPPSFAWPRHPGTGPLTQLLDQIPKILGGITLAAAAVIAWGFATSGASPEFQPSALLFVAACGTIQTTVALLAAWFYLHTTLLAEQGQADLLRLAKRERERRSPPSPEPGPTPLDPSLDPSPSPAPTPVPTPNPSPRRPLTLRQRALRLRAAIIGRE